VISVHRTAIVAPDPAARIWGTSQFCGPARPERVQLWWLGQSCRSPTGTRKLKLRRPRRFTFPALGPPFCELCLFFGRFPMSAARLSRRCCVPFTRSAFADQLLAPSKGQKFGQSTPGKVDDHLMMLPVPCRLWPAPSLGWCSSVRLIRARWQVLKRLISWRCTASRFHRIYRKRSTTQCV